MLGTRKPRLLRCALQADGYGGMTHNQVTQNSKVQLHRACFAMASSLRRLYILTRVDYLALEPRKPQDYNLRNRTWGRREGATWQGTTPGAFLEEARCLVWCERGILTQMVTI